MRKLVVLIFCLFHTSFLFVNCAHSSKRSRPPVTAIKLLSKNKKITLGTEFEIQLKTKIKDGSFRNTEVFLDGKSLLISDKIDFNAQIKTSELGVGTHIIKAISTTNEGVAGENFSEFLLLSDVKPVKYDYKVIRTYPHNPDYFTEGLEFNNGYLYEGTGQEGSSAIYKVDLLTSKVLKSYKIEDQYFGEGITILNNKLYQLTYKSQLGFVRDLNTFDVLKTWNYKNLQGWGLTNDGSSIIMSDGTEFIYFIDPQTFSVNKKIQVCNQSETINNINELEYINGEIWANIWMTDTVIKIDPKSGKVLAEIDLSGILPTNLSNQKNPADVLNGIAFDKSKNKIVITGKYWPKLFEIQLVKH